MGEKINNLEKGAVQLWHDYSEEAVKLENEFKDKGYEVKVTLSGASKPILSDPSHFLSGYTVIRRAYHLD